METPGVKGLPINIETRGSGGDFQQVGMLYKNNISDDSKAPGNNTDNNVLPLYGKPTYQGSKQWSYFTKNDRHNAVKMPMSHKGQKCDNRYGCDEIMNDDLITIPGYNGTFRAVIYDFDAPKYIPFV